MRIKPIAACILIAVAAALISQPAQAEGRAIYVVFNGAPVIFRDQGPVILEGKVFIPLRGLAEAGGAAVDWDDEAKTARLSGQGFEARLTAGEASFTARVSEGEEMKDYTFQLDTPAQIIGGRMMLPLRAIAESAGAEVTWDDATGTVRITAALS